MNIELKREYNQSIPEKTFWNKSELKIEGGIINFIRYSKLDGIIIYRAMYILHDATRVS